VVDGVEERQVAPTAARVNAILDDVKSVTSTVKKSTEGVETAVEWVVKRLLRGGGVF
jgi:hypothetical protein